MATITITRDLLDELAPEQPMNQDEQGGCVWCGGCPPHETYGYAGRTPEDHDRDCPWLAARRLLEPDAADLKPDPTNVTKAQAALLALLQNHNGRLPVRGADLRVAEALSRKQLVRLVNVGEPWTKGWYREAVLDSTTGDLTHAD